MRVSKVEIKNILGVSELEFVPGTVTVVSGGNGTGKTSVLEAIKAAIGGGHDATLVRKGADAGQVVLVLDDETRITKRITQEKSGVTVDAPKFGKISRPASYLSERIDALAVNPVTFLTASPAKRAEWLLEVMPVEVSDAELKSAGVAALPPATRNGLDRIEASRKAAYDARTGVNRALKEKRATATQLRESLPAMTDVPDVAALRRSREEMQAGQAAEQAALKKATSDALDRNRDSVQREIDAIRAEAQKRIDVLNLDAGKRAAELQASLTERLEAVTASYAPRLEALTSRLATAEEQSKQAIQAAKTRELAERMEGEATRLEDEARALSSTLDNLDALKGRALERFPVKGLEIREGTIYVDGIPFDRLNRAAQVRLALNIARLRAGEIPLVLVDGLECLDEETFRAFEEVGAKSGLQLIVNRVTSGPLKVQSAA